MILPSTITNYEPQIDRIVKPEKVDVIKGHLEKFDEFISVSMPPYRIFNPIVKTETFVALGEILSGQTTVEKAAASIEKNVKDSREQYNYFK